MLSLLLATFIAHGTSCAFFATPENDNLGERVHVAWPPTPVAHPDQVVNAAIAFAVARTTDRVRHVVGVVTLATEGAVPQYLVEVNLYSHLGLPSFGKYLVLWYGDGTSDVVPMAPLPQLDERDSVRVWVKYHHYRGRPDDVSAEDHRVTNLELKRVFDRYVAVVATKAGTRVYNAAKVNGAWEVTAR